MAVYSQFATGSFDGESIVANESYVGAIGAYQMMAESSMNEHAIFEHVLGCDFVEAQANHGYVSESTLEAVNEASGKGIFSKVIAFFKKLGEKIKGIIQNMINKISAMFIKDGKQLVKKFEETIRKKMNNDTYDNNFKYKWCKPQGDTTIVASDIEDIIFSVKLSGSGNSSYKGYDINMMLSNGFKSVLGGARDNREEFRNVDKTNKDANKRREEDLNKQIEKDRDEDNTYYKTITQDDIDDYKEDMLSALLGESTDASSFAKDLDEKLFDTEETKEGLDGADLSDIKNYLSNESKIVKNMDKAKRDVDKAIKKITDEAKRIEKEMDKASGKEGFSKVGKLAQVKASNVTKMGNVCSACNSIYFSAVGAAIKKHYAQCRAVYIKAATYNKKSAKHEAALLEAVVDVSNYEVDQMMPEF